MTQIFNLKSSSDQKIARFLQLTVETTRKILKCDRVLVYSVNKLKKGLVLAESVDSKYGSVLGKTIKDPFLGGRYLEMYSYGMPVAIDDIYIADPSKRDLKEIEKLGVKSLMIAPITVDNQLLALLVAHQCSQIKLWHHEAVIFLTEKANATGLTLAQDYPDFLATNSITANSNQLNFPQNTQQLQQRSDTIQYNSIDHKTTTQKNKISFFPNVKNQAGGETAPSSTLDRKVEEIRRILNCDRIMLYNLSENNYGTIIAESVAPGWLKVQGRVIQDPCLVSQYLEQYRNGKSQTINNIYQSGLPQNYIEQLEQLETKASLVAPVINESRLFGLLLAHQCSNTRQWQQTEIFWFAQIAKQIGFILDNAELLANAKRLRQEVEDEKKWTEHFTDAMQQIRQSLTTEDILNNSVQVVRKILKCDRVVVYTINQDDNNGAIVAESLASGWTEAQGQVIDDICFEPKYIEQYLNGRVRAIDNIYQSNLTPCYIEQLEKLEVKANLVTPIINEGKLFGLLVAHQCSSTRKWQQPEIRWIAQISAQIGFALDNGKIREQLQKSTEMSQGIVQQKCQEMETLKHQIVNILSENSSAYENLAQEAMKQSETTINILYQIQQASDFFNSTALNVGQVKFQGQQNELAVHTVQENLDRAALNFSNVQNTVQNVALEFNNFSSSCQELLQTVSKVKDLSKQIVQKSMNVTRVINQSHIEEETQNSMIDLSDTIFSLMQQLFEATSKIELLFANIQTEVKNKTVVLDSGKQQLTSGIEEFNSVRQKLDRVITINQQMNSIIENIAESVETQIQNSTFANNSVQDVVSVAERISEHSMNITQSFQKLVILVQQL